jgi:hypothetical protein
VQGVTGVDVEVPAFRRCGLHKEEEAFATDDGGDRVNAWSGARSRGCREVADATGKPLPAYGLQGGRFPAKRTPGHVHHS